jgi:hypothetical protein
MDSPPEISALAHTHDHRAYQQKAAAADRIVLLSMLFAMAAVSVGVQWWRTKHTKSFQLSSFLALWMFPALAGVYYFWTRFLFVWLVYSACTAYVVTIARQKPLLPTTPRFIYQYFSALYHGCTYAIVGGYFVFLIVVLVAQPPPGAGRPGSGIPKTWGMVITDYLFSGMIYGLYFCVLTRDVAELSAESISNALGYFKKNDDDSVNQETVPPDNVCALCGNECETLAAATQPGAAMRAHRPRAKPAATVPAQQSEQNSRRKQVLFDDDLSTVATATPEEEEPNDVITDAMDDARHGFVDLQDLEAAQNPHRDEDDDSEELAGVFASHSNFMFNFGNFPGVAGLMNLRGLIRNNARPGIRVAEGKDGTIFKLPCKHTYAHDNTYGMLLRRVLNGTVTAGFMVCVSKDGHSSARKTRVLVVMRRWIWALLLAKPYGANQVCFGRSSWVL